VDGKAIQPCLTARSIEVEVLFNYPLLTRMQVKKVMHAISSPIDRANACGFARNLRRCYSLAVQGERECRPTGRRACR
jgi:hypothetical protein